MLIKGIRTGAISALICLVVAVWLLGGDAAQAGRGIKPPAKNLKPGAKLDKDELAFLIGRSALHQGRLDRLVTPAGPGRSFVVKTTIDQDFQHFLEDLAEKAHAPYVAMAALNPRSGRIHALVSYAKDGSARNYALASAFPAASIFKMVTATAAMEAGGMNPGSQCRYTGRAHTLYRSQIKDRVTKWDNKPDLTESFARSVNPVFGRLAVHSLGPRTLERYARRFGFNQTIQFELPLERSRVAIPKSDGYALAGVGSGFNRHTSISPVHGAMMAAAAINQGVMMEPNVVDRVWASWQGGEQREVYRSNPTYFRRVMQPKTAWRLRQLMQATITEGTCRRSFRRAGTDRVLKNLEIGAKTGSLNDQAQQHRADWFVGYGFDAHSGEALALCVMVAHDIDRRGTRSAKLARQAIKYYFDPGRAPSPAPVEKASKATDKHADS